MNSQYDWDYNCAIVDRLFYMEYFLRGTGVVGFSLLLRDLNYIRIGWYPERAYKRLPVVWKNI